MKHSPENLGRVESVTTIIVNLGTIISWMFSIFTFFVLAWQPEPISLPGILELSPPYKLLFITSIFLGYIQLLRRIWENGKRTHNEVERNFGTFLYSSLIKFKRPIVLIGFLIIFGVTTTVIFQIDLFFGSIVYFFGIAGVIYMLTERKDFFDNLKKQYDDEFRKRWLKRVQKQLYQDGFAHTVNFLNLEEEISEINWAIRAYFDIYEFEKDLKFSLQYIKRNYQTYEICEIRFKHVTSQMSKFETT